MNRGTAAALCTALCGCNGVVAGHTPDAKANTTFETTIRNRHLDKLDILFDIDNSGEMDAWNDYVKQAIPDLVNRFINPNCINTMTMVSSGPSNNGQCANAGERPEFPPVRDMHLGIISSSLGPRGGDACDPTAMAPAPFANLPAHNDDQAHLLNRTLTYTGTSGAYTGASEGTVKDAPGADPFLYWFPTTNRTRAGGGTPAEAGVPVAFPSTLIQDFTDLVGGVGNFGCGLPSPLESWYRFLIQPDPYASIVVENGKAAWSGVDATILQQRHDFLRPDSKVVVVVISPNDDKEIDVRSLGGTAYNYLESSFQPPNATSPGTGLDLRTRFVNMKQRYGADPQFPIQRYVTGLTSFEVPDRSGEYPPRAQSYVGTNDCQNPLFAAALPDGSRLDPASLCHAPPGPRTKDLVYYIHIGGVPSELLHFDPSTFSKSVLNDTDWVKILGKDPLHGDVSGIDPHMIEDYRPRAGVAPPGSTNDADPISGHDWMTDQGSAHVLPVDLQYACIIALATPRDCSLPQNRHFCDCPSVDGALTPEELPPVCDQSIQIKQVAAKAYPTRRELLVAKMLGNQAFVASLCPIHPTEMGTGDPLYGFRPAFASVVLDQPSEDLVAQCLPQPSRCTVLVQLPPAAGGSCLHPSCDPTFGLSTPPASVLADYCRTLEAQYAAVPRPDAGYVGPDPAHQSVCELKELTASNDPADFQAGTCANSMDPGWCYLTGVAAGRCSQAVIFSQGGQLDGTMVHIGCFAP